MFRANVVVERVFRDEGSRVLATLIRLAGGDFEAAEDALSEACARALATWPTEGVPERPAAWLTTVGRRLLLDAHRRRREIATDVPPDVAAPSIDDDALVEALELPDDRLRLLFTCCHPALSTEAQVGLALRTLSGLTTPEIARAFLEPEPTTAQRLVRAKKKIREAGISYQVPGPDDRPERLAAVLAVVYLVFNEGYIATEGDALVRADLAAEAVRLGRLLAELLPDEPEVLGLGALMLLHHARRDARVSAEGDLIPLDEQDRARWNQPEIAEGQGLLQRAIALRRSAPAATRAHPAGPYQLQAAIAALHSSETTDWPQIAALYGALLRVAPTPIVELNAAVAIAMAGGVDDGLRWLEALDARNALPDYHLLPTAQAELLRRANRPTEARAAYDRAIGLSRNAKEKAHLERRKSELE